MASFIEANNVLLLMQPAFDMCRTQAFIPKLLQAYNLSVYCSSSVVVVLLVDVQLVLGMHTCICTVFARQVMENVFA